jgi:AbrB family looped-hinge helix DNA binding protein
MKVTTKGQVTIPVRIRDYLGIVPHSEVDFQVREGDVVLVKRGPAGSGDGGRFTRLRGILRGKLTTDQWLQATRGG